MPNELTVPTVPTVHPASNPPNTMSRAAVPAPTAPPPVQSFINPSLRLDSGLGLVVIEFRNDAGAVTRSIPSQQQLDAYKRTGEAPPRSDEPAS